VLRLKLRSDALFFAGLILVVSPVVTWVFLDPGQIFSLVVVGWIGAS